MIIHSITLENFRQYKGKQKIVFSTEKDKNVTVIVGQNTCGKTTLVQSFVWCLYGKHGFSDGELLNAEIKDDLLKSTIGNVKELAVSIELTHNGEKYLIVRRQKYINSGNDKYSVQPKFSVYVFDDYGPQPLDSTEDELNEKINEIMPQNLSDYFFFWGERIENLSKKSQIADAVRDFLGLTTLDKLKKHLKGAVSELTRQISGPTNNDIIINNKQEEIKKYKKENADYTLYRIEAQKNADQYKKFYDEALEDYINSGSDVIRQKQIILKNKENELIGLNLDLSNKRDIFIKKFNRSFVNIFTENLSQDTIKLLNDYQDDRESWVNVNTKTIDEIIDKSKCICGADVCEGNKAYRNLIELKKYVAPNFIGGLTESFKNNSDYRRKSNKNSIDDIRYAFKEIEVIKNKIKECESNIYELKSKINSTEDMAIKKKKIDGYNKEYTENLSKAGVYAEKIKTNEQKILDCEKIILQRSSLQKKYDDINNCINYANEVFNRVSKEYDEQDNNIRNKLQKYVRDYFDEMYSGDREVVIDNDFKIQAYNYVNGKQVKSEGSPGLETVKNFAFIAALVQVAKDKIKTNGNEVISSEPYPLVLDAPFSQADEVHVPAISSLISKIAEQTILVVMKKDWNYAKSDMKDKVGRYYVLEKESETRTIIKESEEI